MTILQDRDEICAEYGLTPELFKLAFLEWKLVPCDLSWIKDQGLTVLEYLEFVRDHSANLKDIPKVCVLSDNEDKMVEVIKESFAMHKCVRVSGVYHETDNGVQEVFSSLEKFMELLTTRVIPFVTERVDVLYEGKRDSRLPHPAMIRRILQKQYTLGENCRFVTPGCIEPVASTRIMPGGEMTTFSKATIINNFHSFERPLDFKQLGCTCFDDLPEYHLRSAEMVIHVFKAYAAYKFPIFRKIERDGVMATDENCVVAIEFVVQSATCKEAKKYGRSVPIDFKVYGPTASYIAPFLAAAIFAARIALGDPYMRSFVRLAINAGNTYVESSVLNDNNIFTGDQPDLSWGETVGSPQIVTRPDELVQEDAKIDGIFGKGFALLKAIISKDVSVLESIPFHEVADNEQFDRLAARLFDAIWTTIRKNAEKLEAKKPAGALPVQSLQTGLCPCSRCRQGP